MDNNVRFVIFSGANERAIIAACRHFQHNGSKVSIIGVPGVDKLNFSRFYKLIDVLRTKNELDAVDMLASVTELVALYPYEKLVYLPTTESINRIILNNRNDFSTAGLNISLVSKDIYESVSNKETFLNLAQQFKILLPPILENVRKENLPVVAKPRTEYSLKTGKKLYPELIFTQERLTAFLSLKSTDDYFFQKYLDGKSYYYLIHIPEHDNPFILYQRNLLQQENGKSIIMAERCACPDRAFEEKIVSALRSVSFFGLIMIEIMQINNNSYLIEANPRLWGPFELAIKSGLLPEFILRTTSVRTVDTNSNAKYLWLNGYIATLARGEIPRSYLNKRESLLKILPFFLCSDIYLKKDTIALFFYELYFSIKSWRKKRIFTQNEKK